MRVADIGRLLGIRVTAAQRRAMRYLERRGQQFGVHFGYKNAIEKARQDWRDRKTEVKRSWGGGDNAA